MILLLLKRWWPGLAAGSLLLFLAAAALHYRASYGAVDYDYAVKLRAWALGL